MGKLRRERLPWNLLGHRCVGPYTYRSIRQQWGPGRSVVRGSKVPGNELARSNLSPSSVECPAPPSRLESAESAKECVTTHLPNGLAPKMDGA